MLARPGACSVHLEAEVLDLLSQGFGDKEIGLTLGVATRTVKSHIAKAASRLGVRGEKTGHRILLARYWQYPIFRIVLASMTAGMIIPERVHLPPPRSL